jgi:hypothetical protein
MKHKHHDVTSTLKQMHVEFVVYIAESECVCSRVDRGWKTAARGPKPAHTLFCSASRVNVGTFEVHKSEQTGIYKRQIFYIKATTFILQMHKWQFLQYECQYCCSQRCLFPTVVLHVNLKFSC